MQCSAIHLRELDHYGSSTKHEVRSSSCEAKTRSKDSSRVPAQIYITRAILHNHGKVGSDSPRNAEAVKTGCRSTDNRRGRRRGRQGRCQSSSGWGCRTAAGVAGTCTRVAGAGDRRRAGVVGRRRAGLGRMRSGRTRPAGRCPAGTAAGRRGARRMRGGPARSDSPRAAAAGRQSAREAGRRTGQSPVAAARNGARLRGTGGARRGERGAYHLQVRGRCGAVGAAAVGARRRG